MFLVAYGCVLCSPPLPPPPVDELDKADMKRTLPAVDADEDRKPRTKEEMAAESLALRELFADFSLEFPKSASDH